MAGFRPGTSPPPVRMAIVRLPGMVRTESTRGSWVGHVDRSPADARGVPIVHPRALANGRTGGMATCMNRSVFVLILVVSVACGSSLPSDFQGRSADRSSPVVEEVLSTPVG